MIEMKTVKIDPKDCQIILGQAHFIKSVEDLHEALVNSVSGIKFGLAFCESSGPCLVRHSGTDAELSGLAADYALNLSCGHCFIILLKNAFPINLLTKMRLSLIRGLLAIPKKRSQKKEMTHQAIDEILQKMAELPEFAKSPAPLHQVDFEIPLYNVWKQQTKTDGVKHYGNSEVTASNCLPG